MARRAHQGIFTAPVGWFDAGFLVLAVILFIGSRDTLRNYQTRVNDLLARKTVRANSECAVPVGVPEEDPIAD